MTGLFAAQVIVTAICCGFFRGEQDHKRCSQHLLTLPTRVVTPLEEGQGCIASPKHNWVGIYWLSATLLYTASLVLAVQRSLRSLKVKPISYWKLMLRDGLNLYAAIWLVNMVNMLFWFIITPTGPEDPIRTIVTSMAAVLTTSMTLRIILAVRGPLANGGTFAVSTAHSHPSTHVISRSAPQGGPVLSLQHPQQTYTVGLAPEAKTQDWTDKDSDQMVVAEVKGDGMYGIDEAAAVEEEEEGPKGVKVTTQVETDYDAFANKK